MTVTNSCSTSITSRLILRGTVDVGLIQKLYYYKRRRLRFGGRTFTTSAVTGRVRRAAHKLVIVVSIIIVFDLQLLET